MQAYEVLGTFGHADMPECLGEAAKIIQQELCEHHKVERLTDGLQGPLIEAIASDMNGLDDEVVRWMKEGQTPLDIECPILPRGVFLEAAADDNDGEIDFVAGRGN